MQVESKKVKKRKGKKGKSLPNPKPKTRLIDENLEAKNVENYVEAEMMILASNGNWDFSPKHIEYESLSPCFCWRSIGSFPYAAAVLTRFACR